MPFFSLQVLTLFRVKNKPNAQTGKCGRSLYMSLKEERLMIEQSLVKLQSNAKKSVTQIQNVTRFCLENFMNPIWKKEGYVRSVRSTHKAFWIIQK